MGNANFYLVANIFGDLVRSARLSKNLSQRQLAQRIGKSASYINYVESGKNPSSKKQAMQPSVEAVDAIAKVLDISVDQARTAAGYAPKNGTSNIEITPDLSIHLADKNLSTEDVQEIKEELAFAWEVIMARRAARNK